METLTVTAYGIYTIFVATITVLVARILFRNSKTFMLIIFSDREHLANATNRLFEVGFFLLSFGIGLWYLTIYDPIATVKTLFEALSVKIGGFTIFMGLLLFANLYMFFRGMKARRNRDKEVVVAAA